MITASRDVFYNILMGEWKGLNISVMQVSSDGQTYTKVFKLDEFLFDEVDACENCRAPESYCDECDGVVEILALVGFVQIKRRLVEDGFVIPLLGDVLFDLRESHLAILTDTDVVVISRAEDGIDALDSEDNNNTRHAKSALKNTNIKLRMYLATKNKVKRLAVNALQDGRKFADLAGKKAVAVELTYVEEDKVPIYLRSIKLFNVYFDLDGQVNAELTFPEHRSSRELPDKHQDSKVVELGRRDKKPELTDKQKEMLIEKLIKDFGKEVWDNTPMIVKAALE